MLVLVDAFQNFRNTCLEIPELDHARFFTKPGLAQQEDLQKNKEKLDLLNDIDMLLMLEICPRGGICHTIHQYAKGNNKYIKDYDKKQRINML